ncbi:hypothetical protein [Cellulosilyticum sp. WCF-2]|uniref:hypothetical protein n=1 Tax=Cellulosilyticum sp. WCF-2 TaxID=2497860 RepID=UPI000F8CC280|nr:hypothetical protein [Cellulosilyticum sp. WCF-2]QEH67313.1 hypothetical protein EKH84_02230 [Cellulosilyticum sp. WCF-2]
MAITFSKDESKNENELKNEKGRSNMSISLDQIDLIMKRTNATYTEAKDALERSNGDIVEALALLEKEGKATRRTNINTTQEQINTYVDTLKTTHFVLSKDDHDYIHAPLIAVLVATVLCFHVSVIALVIALICGFKIKLTDKITHKVRFSNDDFMKS